MTNQIKADLYRYDKRMGLSGFISAWFIPGFRYTYLLRKSKQFRKKHPLGFLFRILLRHYSIIYGYQIYPNTTIGEGFYIGHWGPIVINGHAIIGKNCNVANGVTIGQENRGNRKGAPVLGDNVWIGTNAVLVGKIHIGDHVMIAPNAFVNMDIPPNSIAVGNPAKIIKKENTTEAYIENIYDR